MTHLTGWDGGERDFQYVFQFVACVCAGYQDLIVTCVVAGIMPYKEKEVHEKVEMLKGLVSGLCLVSLAGPLSLCTQFLQLTPVASNSVQFLLTDNSLSECLAALLSGRFGCLPTLVSDQNLQRHLALVLAALHSLLLYYAETCIARVRRKRRRALYASQPQLNHSRPPLHAFTAPLLSITAIALSLAPDSLSFSSDRMRIAILSIVGLIIPLYTFATIRTFLSLNPIDKHIASRILRVHASSFTSPSRVLSSATSPAQALSAKVVDASKHALLADLGEFGRSSGFGARRAEVEEEVDAGLLAGFTAFGKGLSLNEVNAKERERRRRHSIQGSDEEGVSDNEDAMDFTAPESDDDELVSASRYPQSKLDQGAGGRTGLGHSSPKHNRNRFESMIPTATPFGKNPFGTGLRPSSLCYAPSSNSIRLDPPRFFAPTVELQLFCCCFHHVQSARSTLFLKRIVSFRSRRD
ncbi:hypothetical protein BC830DRAFT_684913 [Chytriomyces sp. MP71]|nr:hypothetical protein BC830DRAFT_684913 [Chytriomyces sp. MP71]